MAYLLDVQILDSVLWISFSINWHRLVMRRSMSASIQQNMRREKCIYVGSQGQLGKGYVCEFCEAVFMCGLWLTAYLFKWSTCAQHPVVYSFGSMRMYSFERANVWGYQIYDNVAHIRATCTCSPVIRAALLARGRGMQQNQCRSHSSLCLRVLWIAQNKQRVMVHLRHAEL